MAKAAQRVGDMNQVGGVILNGDSSVLINGRAAAVVGSSVSPHPCCGSPTCPPTHCSARTTALGTGVLIGGKPLVVTGDKDTCSHSRVMGSADVLIG
jgi:uncharacterized Zn-binding protein involved in type VI secretion